MSPERYYAALKRLDIRPLRPYFLTNLFEHCILINIVINAKLQKGPGLDFWYLAKYCFHAQVILPQMSSTLAKGL